MLPTTLAVLLEFSRTAFSMSLAGLVLLAISLFTAKGEFVRAQGAEKIVALTSLCFAIPLAVFGAEHLSGAKFIMNMVPSYVPWHLFWAYFVGFALIAASLSIATDIQVQWSGLLFGIMMFLFVAMIHSPGAIERGDRISWTIVFREMSFGGGGWVLAGGARGSLRGPGKILVTAGRILIALTAIFFGIQHFLHPLGLPAVPLEKQMPVWVPIRPFIDYLTGALLVAAGVCFLLLRNVHRAAKYLGAWILAMIVLIYVPVMIMAQLDPSSAVKVEGLNYFADTLLFAGVILSLARITASKVS